MHKTATPPPAAAPQSGADAHASPAKTDGPHTRPAPTVTGDATANDAAPGAPTLATPGYATSGNATSGPPAQTSPGHADGGKAAHLSRMAAGFIAVLVGYTSSAAIVFQAAHAAGATPEMLASWLWALGLGMGVTCIGLSLFYRTPVLTAWSTPGAALLATALVGVPMPQAVGAFLFASALMTIVGMSGSFDRIMQRVPAAIASAMLGGILLRFGIAAFSSFTADNVLVGIMLASYFAGRRWLPRYAVPLTFLAGIATATLRGQIAFAAVQWQWTTPVFTMPDLTVASLLGVGVPLFVVTLASQNVPGVAVLRANGYKVPASPLVSWTGITGLVLAPFGGFAFNLAAITAAICMTRDADPNPNRRYLAAVWAGIFYIITGILGGTVASVLATVPQPLILSIAGLALLTTIGNSLSVALLDEKARDGALVTFLVSASGLTLFDVGGPFWGLLLGLAVNRLLKA